MSAMRCAELVGAENLIHPPDLGVSDFLVHATMWDIESNSVGNALRQAAVPPVQAGSVGTPPGGVDKTEADRGVRQAKGRGWGLAPTEVGPLPEFEGSIGRVPPTVTFRRARQSHRGHRCGGAIASLRRRSAGPGRDCP